MIRASMARATPRNGIDLSIASTSAESSYEIPTFETSALTKSISASEKRLELFFFITEVFL